jgi:trk system potassium uptake protein TrkA
MQAQADARPAPRRDDNYVIVVGGGRVGFYLAKELIELGYEVLVIENDEGGPRAKYIADQLGSAVIRGDGCEASVLDDAGTARAGMFIAVTGDDEDNLVACQVAKRKFGVPLTIARLNDPRNEKLFTDLGIDVTVSATTAILDKIDLQLPVHRLHRLLHLQKSDLDLVEISLPERAPVVGKPLKEVLLPQGSLIILVVDAEGTPRLPTSDTILHGGDEIIAMARVETEDTLRTVLTGQRDGF